MTGRARNHQNTNTTNTTQSVQLTAVLATSHIMWKVLQGENGVLNGGGSFGLWG
jgi:hypothetical protein